jgi:hypothetical protein
MKKTFGAVLEVTSIYPQIIILAAQKCMRQYFCALRQKILPICNNEFHGAGYDRHGRRKLCFHIILF